MITNFRTAVVLGVALGGFAAQLTSQAQRALPGSDESAASHASSGADPVQSALVEYPAIKEVNTEDTKPVTDSTSPVTTASSVTAKADASATESSSTSATPGTVPVTLRSEAVLKEIAAVKKQFAQMQDEM